MQNGELPKSLALCEIGYFQLLTKLDGPISTPATSTIFLSSPSSEGLFYEQLTQFGRLTARQISKTEYHSTRLNTVQINPIASIMPQLDN